MKYRVERNTGYDFISQSYASKYPNIHRYPATMLPQIGIKLLEDFNIKNGKLLDPYCGSGSSFASALEYEFEEMQGFDINPLAVLISRAKFTKVNVNAIIEAKRKLREDVFEYIKKEENLNKLPLPKITNMDFWFSKEVLQNLNIIKHFIYKITDENLRNIFLVPFSETVRECSYTRNKEFKLYRMKAEDILNFNPDSLGLYFKKLNDVILIYSNVYFPKLDKQQNIDLNYSKFEIKENYFDTVLTSPPYGDSKTTVAYGQFSTLSNEFLGIEYARKIDRMLMGGTKSKELYTEGIIRDFINQINEQAPKRALEVSQFYNDLEKSIHNVAKSVKAGGKIFYVVGNRTVKNIQLPTDQFIAEKFEQNNFKHLVTFERALSSKAMPSKNSPTNKAGKKVNTMLYEYIVVCEKANSSFFVKNNGSHKKVVIPENLESLIYSQKFPFRPKGFFRHSI